MKKLLLPIIFIVLFTTGCKLNTTSQANLNNSTETLPAKDKIIEIDINNELDKVCKQKTDTLKINVTSPEFSKDKELFLAAFVDAVYRKDNYEYDNIIRQWKFYSVEHRYDANTGSEFVIAANNDLIVVGFVGSNEKLDWRKDMDAQPTGALHFSGLTHKGMTDGFEGSLKSLHAELSTLLNKNNRPIIFTGHSLGGAHALLAATYFSLRNADNTYYGPRFNINGVYTFGQPRVGNNVFATQVNDVLKEKYFRIYNGYDPVAHLFPQSRASIEQMKAISPTLFNHNNWGIHLNIAEYTHPASLLLVLREAQEGAVSVTTEEDAKYDLEYWNYLTEMLSKSKVEAIKILEDHMTEKYLCNSLKFYQIANKK